MFLAPGFLPDRAAELALEAGAVAVSEPLGADPELARTDTGPLRRRRRRARPRLTPSADPSQMVDRTALTRRRWSPDER